MVSARKGWSGSSPRPRNSPTAAAIDPKLASLKKEYERYFGAPDGSS